VLLGSSAACPHQAFRIGQCAWGIQFHPEVTENIIRDWCAWGPETAVKADKLIFELLNKEKDYHAVSQQLLESFL
jgi:GMP synthase-like glutamine amidotransferase